MNLRVSRDSSRFFLKGRWIPLLVSLCIHGVILISIAFRFSCKNCSISGEKSKERMQYVNLSPPAEVSMPRAESSKESPSAKPRQSRRAKQSPPAQGTGESVLPSSSALKSIADNMFAQGNVIPRMSPSATGGGIPGDIRGPSSLEGGSTSPFPMGHVGDKELPEIINLEEVRRELRRRYQGLARPGSTVRVMLTLVIDKKGRVISGRIEESSGDQLYDRIALDVMRSLARFSPDIVKRSEAGIIGNIGVRFIYNE